MNTLHALFATNVGFGKVRRDRRARRSEFRMPFVLALVGATLLAGCAHKSAYQRGVDDGYLIGSSDSIKRQYWLKQALEKKKQNQENGDEAGRTVYYTFPGPTDTADGRKLVPNTVTVPVKE